MAFQIGSEAATALISFLKYLEEHGSEVGFLESYDIRSRCSVYHAFIPNGPTFDFTSQKVLDPVPESIPHNRHLELPEVSEPPPPEPAVKILRYGKSEGGWRGEIVCTGKGNGNNGCGATLSVHEKALYNTYSHARDETDRYVTVRCPHCQAQTDVWSCGGRNHLLPYEVAMRISRKG